MAKDIKHQKYSWIIHQGWKHIYFHCILEGFDGLSWMFWKQLFQNTFHNLMKAELLDLVELVFLFSKNYF